MRDHFPVLDTLVSQNFSTGVPLWEIVFQYYCWHFYNLVCYHIVTSTQSFHWAKEAILEWANISFKCTFKCQSLSIFNTFCCRHTQKKSSPFIVSILKTFFTINSLAWEHLEKHVMVFCRFFSLKQIHSNPGIALNLVSTYYPSGTIWMSTGGYPYNHP